MSKTIRLHHPDKDETVEVAVGFSWGALLLGFAWALSRKMWFAAFLMLAATVVLFTTDFESVTGAVIAFVVSILFTVACGVYGNRWHRWTLERRGYVVI